MKKAVSIILAFLLFICTSCSSVSRQQSEQTNGSNRIETSAAHQVETDQAETEEENHIKYSEERDEWYDEDAGIWLGYITVIMVPEEGYKLLDYSVEDFSEVPGKYIIDGSSFVKNNMQKYIEETGKPIEELMPDYRQVIYIRVDASSVEEIYSWIEILLQRDDILSAEVSPEKTPSSNNEEQYNEEVVYSLETIIVVMSSEESYKLLDYCAEDFSEIPCKDVYDASSGRKKKIREQIETSGGTVEEIFPEYKQILILRVDAESEEEIRSWVQILLQRDDILSAEIAPLTMTAD